MPTTPTLREEFKELIMNETTIPYNREYRERDLDTITNFFTTWHNNSLTSLAEKLGEEEDIKPLVQEVVDSKDSEEFIKNSKKLDVIIGLNSQLRKDKDIILNSLLK